jgi:pimeloyl-ACP methyl ester carboxylesterase
VSLSGWQPLDVVALLALTLGTLALLTWLHLVFWRRRLSVEMAYDEHLRLPTADGSAIELRRIRSSRDAYRVDASGPVDARDDASPAPPVLLIHGLAANHRNLDVHPDHSLARHLAGDGGRDVFLVTLRAGRSGLRLGERLDFSSMVAHDLPLAVETVLHRSGARALDLVGFSMGGMLILAGLGRTVPAPRVRRAVLIGAPGLVGTSVRWLDRLAPPWFPGRLPFRLYAQLWAFLVGRVRTPFHRLLYDPRQAMPGLVEVTMMDALADLPGALYAELARMAKRGGELRIGGEPVLPGLAGVTVPALFVAGDADHLAPPEAVRAGFDAWGADQPAAASNGQEGDARGGVEKRFVVLGSDETGHYGHGDLVIGRSLEADLFAPIADFLSLRRPFRSLDGAGRGGPSGSSARSPS